MTQKERILEFMSYLGISQRSFEGSIGVSVGAISHSNGKLSKNIISRTLEEYPQLNREWLLTGDGKMVNGVEEEKTEAEILRAEIEELKETIRRQRREIDGLYERIEELKRGTAVQHSVMAG